MNAQGERGAATVEHIGVIVLVVALMMTVVTAATPVGQTIAAKLCQAFGTECGSAATPEADPDPQPTTPCVVDTAEQSVDGSISVSIVDVGQGNKMVTEELSDGTFRVTLADSASAGATATAGEAYGELRVLEHGGGVDLSASARAGGKLEGGLEYSFDSQDQVDDFHEWAYREFGKDVAKGGLSQAAGSSAAPVVGLGVDAASWALDRVTGYDYSPPEPGSMFIEGGLVLGGQAAASGITGGAGGELSFGNALGYEQDLESGEKTIYTEVTLDAEAAAELGFSSVGEFEGNVATVIETAVDENNQLTGVGFNGTATAEGAYDLTRLAGTPLQDGGGKGINLQAQFDVTDENRDRALAALGGIGVTQAAGGTAMSHGAAFPWIFAEAQSTGDVTAQALDVSSTGILEAGLSLKAPAIGGAGGQLDVGTSSTTVSDAWFLGDHGVCPEFG